MLWVSRGYHGRARGGKGEKNDGQERETDKQERRKTERQEGEGGRGRVQCRAMQCKRRMVLCMPDAGGYLAVRDELCVHCHLRGIVLESLQQKDGRVARTHFQNPTWFVEPQQAVQQRGLEQSRGGVGARGAG